MRCKLIRLINLLKTRKYYLVSFWSRFFLGTIYSLAIFLLYFAVCLVSLPVFLTKTPYESFQLLARRNGSGQFIDSYEQHILMQKVSVVTALLSVLLIIVKTLSVIVISYYSITPEQTVAKDGGVPSGCAAYRSASGETTGCDIWDTFDFGGVWWNTTGTCSPQDFTWKYYDYATLQTVTMDDSFTAFTVPSNPIVGVNEYQLTDQTVTCRTAGHYQVLIDIGGISPSVIDTFVGTPTAPSGAATSPSASDQLTITWSDNSNNEQYYRVENVVYSKGCGLYAEHGTASYNNTSYDIDGLTPNTLYCTRVRASNPVGSTTYSTADTVRTYSPAPDVAADRSTSTWYTTGKFDFTNNDSWGAGGTQYFRYVWDESDSHTWTDTETQWAASDLSIDGVESAGLYLHLKSFNADNAGSNDDAVTLGPFFYDSVDPPTTAQISDGLSDDITWSNSNTVIQSNWDTITDATSGLNKYQYAVGTTSGGTDLIDWTDHDTTLTLDLSGQSLLENETYYVSVRGVDNAGLAGESASSNGFTVDTVEPSVTDNETTDRGWLNSGISYDVDFSNQGSGSNLDYAQYSVGSSSGGTDIIGWTNIFTEDQASYSTDWQPTFDTLSEGTNYVSVKTADLAGNIKTSTDVFTIKKDTIASEISNIQADTETNQIIITWETSEPTTTQVEWGASESLGYITTLDSTLTTDHSVTLSGLNDNQTYYYRVLAQDKADNPTTSTIQSSATSELEPTLITKVQVSQLTETGVTITWKTNHASSSKVRYGLTIDYGSEVSNSALVTNHSLTLTNLVPGTRYHYEVLSTGNTTAIDADATFTTIAQEVEEEEEETDTPETEEEEQPFLEPVSGPYTFDLPTPTIISPADEQTVGNPKPRITGLAKSGNIVKVFIDGQYNGYTTATVDSSGTGNFSYLPFLKLSVGWHTLRVEAWSDSHRSKKTSAVNFKIPTPYVPPTLTKPVVKDGDSPSILIPGIARNDSYLKVYIDGDLVDEIKVNNDDSGTANFSVDVSTNYGLADGEHIVTIVACDENGIASEPSEPVKFTKTSVSPNTGKKAVVFDQSVTYQIKSGDSLWKIAEQYYGNGTDYIKLIAANISTYSSLQTNPGLIRPGWVIDIP